MGTFTSLSPDALDNNGIDGILKILADSTAAEIDNGRTWYTRANRFAAKLAALSGLRLETVAAVLARLSPQVSWADNKGAALEICCQTENRPLCDKCYPDNVRRAEDIARANDSATIALEVLPRKGYSRPKISAFYGNIAAPDKDGTATVDTWAIRVWLGDPGAPAYRITIKQSRRIQADYLRAASHAGMRSHELQAIVWVAAHRISKEREQRSLFEVPAGIAYKI